MCPPAIITALADSRSPMVIPKSKNGWTRALVRLFSDKIWTLSVIEPNTALIMSMSSGCRNGALDPNENTDPGFSSKSRTSLGSALGRDSLLRGGRCFARLEDLERTLGQRFIRKRRVRAAGLEPSSPSFTDNSNSPQRHALIKRGFKSRGNNLRERNHHPQARGRLSSRRLDRLRLWDRAAGRRCSR